MRDWCPLKTGPFEPVSQCTRRADFTGNLYLRTLDPKILFLHTIEVLQWIYDRPLMSQVIGSEPFPERRTRSNDSRTSESTGTHLVLEI